MVSAAFKQAAFAQDTGDVILVLLTISHPSISPSIRVVNNTQQITSRGETYEPFPFEVTLPDQREDAPPSARLSIDNISREIGQAIRSITSPAFLTIEVIRAADPDVVEKRWPNFTLRDVKWDWGKVSGDLRIDDFTTEPYPAGIFSPASFLGLR